jgi:AcrR family transcriptional regulator
MLTSITPHAKAPQDPATPVDGRHLRSVNSRARVLAAMLELVQEGNPDPRAEDVASRAGVGLRTVFRLYSDMESVCAEMLAPQALEFVACFTDRFQTPRGPQRVLELFDRLGQLYERRAPMRRAGSIRRHTSPSLARAMAELDAAIADFIARQIKEDTPGAAFRRSMLNLLISYETWLRLRDNQSLSYEETFDTLRKAIKLHLA